MSKVKDASKGKKDEGLSWNKWLQQTYSHTLSFTKEWGYTGYIFARHIGWFIVTTGMITALPLIFEIKREAAVEELEQLQISAALAEGKSPHELAQSGLTGALEPKVLK